MVKFPILHIVRIVRGDQAMARYCYVNSLWWNAVSESLSIEKSDRRDETNWATPIEDLLLVALDDELPDRVVYVSALLDAGCHEELIQFLKKNRDVFLWCYKDMSGIDP